MGQQPMIPSFLLSSGSRAAHCKLRGAPAGGKFVEAGGWKVGKICCFLLLARQGHPLPILGTFGMKVEGKKSNSADWPKAGFVRQSSNIWALGIGQVKGAAAALDRLAMARMRKWMPQWKYGPSIGGGCVAQVA